MPVANRTPVDTRTPGLRPYLFHGLDLVVQGSHGVGDCPFCGRGGKFSVAVDSGLWRCWSCGGGTDNGGGNPLIFIRLLYERSCHFLRSGMPQNRLRGQVGAIYPPGVLNGTGGVLGNGNGKNGHGNGFLAEVAADRKLLDPATVAAWGVCRAADGAWLVPGYGPDGKLDQLYRRVRVQDKGAWSWSLLPTPGVWPEGKGHALHLPVDDFDLARPNIVVCEGPWDGMVLWETWDRDCRDTNIIAVPGCNVWRDEWTEMCRGKCVTLLYDSDHPRSVIPGGRASCAGYDGMVRVAKKLSGIAQSVKWLRWGPDGYDPSRPSGWDVRDYLTME